MVSMSSSVGALVEVLLDELLFVVLEELEELFVELLDELLLLSVVAAGWFEQAENRQTSIRTAASSAMMRFVFILFLLSFYFL